MTGPAAPFEENPLPQYIVVKTQSMRPYPEGAAFPDAVIPTLFPFSRLC